MRKPLSEVLFENSFVEDLPGDDSLNPTPRQTPQVCYSLCSPTSVAKSELVISSGELIEDLNLEPLSKEDLLILSGSRVPLQSQAFAMCYGGHQFGHWAGQLGDGRALILGEIRDKRGQKQEIQLKGAGLTPYSRTADGRAVLRSSLREFLASEAMSHLGVPTTRALSLVNTGESVLRDLFYTGDVKPEPGAITTRVAPSFLRFGNFEILAAQSEPDLLRKLIKWSVKCHFPQFKNEKEETKQILKWYKEISLKTAWLITEWLRVGFVHGVMNTDNMSILGLTLDYGPFGWLEEYDPSWTPNTTDLPGRRYAFAHQPPVAHWNLARLGDALTVLEIPTGDLALVLEDFASHFQKYFCEMMARKLGLSKVDLVKDQKFLKEWDEILQLLHVDMTLFYRKLSDWHPSQEKEVQNEKLRALKNCCYEEVQTESWQRFLDWIKDYGLKIQETNLSLTERKEKMDQANPKYILRNYMAYEATQAIEKDQNSSLLNEIFEVLKKPYEEQPQFEKWAQKRPHWAKNQPGSSTLSCSS